MGKTKGMVLVALRILAGGVLIFSAVNKLIVPYQNFLYVLQNYKVFPAGLVDPIARVFPWAELLVGVFVASGLWLPYALKAEAVLASGFIAITGQALLRRLPIDDCGCFGDIVAVPLWLTFTLDITLLGVCVYLIKNSQNARFWSLDAFVES